MNLLAKDTTNIYNLPKKNKQIDRKNIFNFSIDITNEREAEKLIQTLADIYQYRNKRFPLYVNKERFFKHKNIIADNFKKITNDPNLSHHSIEIDQLINQSVEKGYSRILPALEDLSDKNELQSETLKRIEKQNKKLLSKNDLLEKQLQIQSEEHTSQSNELKQIKENYQDLENSYNEQISKLDILILKNNKLNDFLNSCQKQFQSIMTVLFSSLFAFCIIGLICFKYFDTILIDPFIAFIGSFASLIYLTMSILSMFFRKKNKIFGKSNL